MRRLAVLAVLAVLVRPASADERWSGPPVLVTRGEATVRVAPDQAFVTFATEARAAQAKPAQQQDAKAMTDVRARLKDAGVPDDAVRTVSYDLRQEYDYVGGKQVARGYLARHAIEVRVDGVERLGEVIERAVASGAASVQGVRFDLKDRAGVERQALREAVEDARARADAAATGAGTGVTGVIRIEEDPTRFEPRPMAMRAMAAEAAPGVAPPTAAGEIEVRASVSLTSALR